MQSHKMARVCPVGKNLGFLKLQGCTGPSRQCLQGHRNDHLVKAMEKEKRPYQDHGAGRPAPGLLNCTSNRSVGGKRNSGLCVSFSSLPGRERTTYRETRTNPRVMWTFTPHKVCYSYWTHYHLPFLGKIEEST